MTKSPDLQALPRFQAADYVKGRYTAVDVFARVDATMAARSEIVVYS